MKCKHGKRAKYKCKKCIAQKNRNFKSKNPDYHVEWYHKKHPEAKYGHGSGNRLTCLHGISPKRKCKDCNNERHNLWLKNHPEFDVYGHKLPQQRDYQLEYELKNKVISPSMKPRLTPLEEFFNIDKKPALPICIGCDKPFHRYFGNRSNLCYGCRRKITAPSTYLIHKEFELYPSPDYNLS